MSNKKDPIMQAYQHQIDENILRKSMQAATVAAVVGTGAHYTSELMKPAEYSTQEETQNILRRHPVWEAAEKKTTKLAKQAQEAFPKLSDTQARTYASLAVKHAHPDFPKAEDLMASMAQESSFKHTATSNAGAYGLMQVRPSIWKISTRDIDTPEKQVAYGTGIMRQYYKKLGDKDSTLQAYNVGITAFKKGKRNIDYVIKHKEYNEKFNKPDTD